jgi:hypothetical protein
MARIAPTTPIIADSDYNERKPPGPAHLGHQQILRRHDFAAYGSGVFVKIVRGFADRLAQLMHGSLGLEGCPAQFLPAYV